MAWQPARGYRAGVDAVFLAAACPARTGDTILELGCGVGVASLSLLARVPGTTGVGVEKQASYAELGRQNASETGLPLTVVTGDIAALPDVVRKQQFHHVIFNPPYYDRGRRLLSPDTGRETALSEETSLKVWVETAIKRLRPRGQLTVIHRTERLAELLALLHPRIGSIAVQPLAARQGRASHLVLIRAQKDGNAPFILHPAIILHAAAQHVTDGDDYTPDVADVLRNGAAMPFGA
ncbi:tRNA1(Val) (adenine(37)-N6)-methyltransferase [Shimia ponticola]|uniref:tRNA1(Val) (adenine(37)-N6)-methyltransferase n=1 Tax=Shimia ponticola TaxID=2582893 RepID=UPI0011BE6EDE|nr:methyltransferase [Shimia ponticola]